MAGEHTPRQMRSERREACCALLGAIAHYCDLPSLCLSVPQPDGTLLPIRMDTLADRAGLNLRRAERAMRDLVCGGLLTIYPRCELKQDGSYIGRAAIRVVPAMLFGLFGLEARLEHERQRIIQKRAQDRDGTPNRTAAARLKIGVRAFLDRAAGGGPVLQPAAVQIPDVSSESPSIISSSTFPHSKHIDAMRAMLDDAGSSWSAERTDTTNRLARPAVGADPAPLPVRCDTS
ncbi:MAG: replication protein RepA [Gammaproteobacteria bacterium]|nr:replication protein RepA [Gammaproteobacteria bacterium]